MSEATPSSADSAESRSESPRRRAVNALWEKLKHADPGTLAALRRSAGSEAATVAFYRFATGILEDHYENLPDQGEWRDLLDARWSVVVAAMASGKDFLARISLGRALAEADVAEMRVLRLLEAGEAQLPEIVRTLVHQLVQKGQPFDPHDLADLVLEPESEWPRRRIARDFYRHQKN